MFARAVSILLNENNIVILEIASRENDKMKFVRPVLTIDHPKLNECLTVIDEKKRRFTI